MHGKGKYWVNRQEMTGKFLQDGAFGSASGGAQDAVFLLA